MNHSPSISLETLYSSFFSNEENKDFFKSVDMDTGMAISSFINSENVMKMVEKQKKGDNIDMCKAMEDWAAEERLEGRLEGKLEGEENKLVDLIRKKLEKGKDIGTIADEVEETEVIVKQLIHKYNL